MCNGAKMYEANRTTAAEKRQARNALVASPTGDVPLLPFVLEYSVPGARIHQTILRLKSKNKENSLN
ncbi:hypothetical protein DPMN_107415 [Dreissena polymorpha]|uniref:Uncharacterized protein n=1 Tax=Dreissena polymorpha TaxID=45954 RepID=A0A9D4K6T6_DREPO|nr:hypothetical protein DPMN_107415 [Dreissena polymorpha]